MLHMPHHRGRNVISRENRKLGDSDWIIENLATNQGDLRLRRAVEGYASATSIAPGETIQLFVHTAEPSYYISIFRLGWYDGKGGRRVWPPDAQYSEYPGLFQPIPEPFPDPTTGPFECAWVPTQELTVPHDWVSGVYVAKLTAGTSQLQNYILFVVRDDTRRAHYLFQTSVTTYQAYNQWPFREWNSTGRPELGHNPSLYPSSIVPGPDRVPPVSLVSFNRPYGREDSFMTQAQHRDILSTLLGAGELFWWELNMLRFLEREGYDVSYCTNIDIHRNRSQLHNCTAFLSVGHDEYWSNEMRRNVESARRAGVNLAFFSANTCFDRIRFVDAECRTFERYTDLLNGARYYPIQDVSTKRGSGFNDEDALLGIRLIGVEAAGDMTGFDESSWVLDGTGLSQDSTIPGIIGYEVDGQGGHSPVGRKEIARSLYRSYKDPEGDLCADRYASLMTIYADQYSGAMVLASGTIQWSWALDDYCVPDGGRPSLTNPAAQQIMRNVLKRFVRKGAAYSDVVLIDLGFDGFDADIDRLFAAHGNVVYWQSGNQVRRGVVDDGALTIDLGFDGFDADIDRLFAAHGNVVHWQAGNQVRRGVIDDGGLTIDLRFDRFDGGTDRLFAAHGDVVYWQAGKQIQRGIVKERPTYRPP
jgi:hypothetical protein